MVSVHCLLLALAATAADIPAQQPSAPAEPGNAATVQSKPLTLEMRGDIYMARKMYREAIEVYRTAANDLNVKDPAQKERAAILANKVGIGYHQMLDLDTAKKHYERALKLKSNYAEAINNLGTVHYAKKSYRRAVGQYNKALKHAPNSASIYSNLGTAQFARKKYKQASESYAKALELDPDVFEHRSSHGVLLQERSVQERAKFHYYLSKLYAKSGQVERALLYIRKALEEGFKERNKFKEEPEFAGLQENPEFQQLLTLEPRVL